MVLLLRGISLIWLLLGLTNLFVAPDLSATFTGPPIVGPVFNGWFYLLSGATLFVLAYSLHRRMAKVGKKPPGKAIDPKNEARLRELRILRGNGLVKGSEYRKLREEILKGL